MSAQAWTWLLACATLAGCRVSERSAVRDLERMRQQPRYETYGSSTFFDDSSAMRTPPQGTVARERVTGDALRTSGRADSVYADRIPIALDRAAVERGRGRFEIFCGPCHGVEGNGAGPVARNMTLRPPPSLYEARIRAMPPGRLYEVVTEGYGLMPSYAGDLPVDDRWKVVAYVRALQLSRFASRDGLPADAR